MLPTRMQTNLGGEMSNICMIDSGGRRQAVPLVRMQSEAGLREIMIANPDRTAECWAEMQRRHDRMRAARRAVRKIKIEEAR